jgi:hypothetical protein
MKTDYTKIDSELFKAVSMLSQEMLMPTNYDSEKEKFFSDTEYNPVFSYPKTNLDLENIKNNLLAMEIPSSRLGKIFRNKRDEILGIIEMISSLGSHSPAVISREIYGFPEETLVRKAWHVMAIEDKPDLIFIPSMKVKICLEKAIEKYGLDWKVKEKAMGIKCSLDFKKKILYLKKDFFFTDGFMKRILIHEIGTHILRYENSLNHKYKIFSIGLSNYIQTEEGLALYNEEKNACLSIPTLKTHAARVIAIDLASQSSFSETFKTMVPFVGKENAYELAAMAKYGMADTSVPGAFTKSYLPLKGFFKLRKYLFEGGMINDLYYGRIGTEDLARIHLK